MYENIKVDLDKKIITLPKLGNVKIRGYRHLLELPGRILNATVSRVANKYYVSVCRRETRSSEMQGLYLAISYILHS